MITYSSYDNDYISLNELAEAITFWGDKALYSNTYKFNFHLLTLNVPDYLITEKDGKIRLEVFAHNKKIECDTVRKVITLPIVYDYPHVHRWKFSNSKPLKKIICLDIKAALEYLSDAFSDFREKCENLDKVQQSMNDAYPQFNFKLKFNTQGIYFYNITFLEAFMFINELRANNSIINEHIDAYEKYVNNTFMIACHHCETDCHSDYYSSINEYTVAPELMTYESYVELNKPILKMEALVRDAGDKIKAKIATLNTIMAQANNV